MNEKVSVTVNGQQTTFFLGLSVRHAIGGGAARAVERGLADVRDAAGNQVGLDGALYDGETLIVHTLRSPAEIQGVNAMSPRQSIQDGGPAAQGGESGSSAGSNNQGGQQGAQDGGGGQQGRTKTPGGHTGSSTQGEAAPPWSGADPATGSGGSGGGGGQAPAGCTSALLFFLGSLALLAMLGAQLASWLS